MSDPSTPETPQNPWGQQPGPSAPRPAQPDPYPQQQAYPQQQPSYPQHQYGTGYGVQAGQPYAITLTPDAKPLRKSTLGVVAFAIVAVATLAITFVAVRIGQAYGQALAAVGANTSMSQAELTAALSSPAAYPYLDQMSQMLPFAGVVSLVGLGGWIASIVATARATGRPWGITGIVLGVVAPIAAIIMMISIAVTGMG